MSRHPRGLVVLLGSVLLAGAASVHAQPSRTLASERLALRARVDSLRALERQLRAAAEDSGLVDTVQVGTVRLRTTAALASVGQAAILRASDDARQVLGVEADSLGADITLSLREHWTSAQVRFSSFTGRSLTPTEPRVGSVTLDRTVRGAAQTGVRFEVPLDGDELRASVLMTMERAAAARLPLRTAEWLGNRVPLRAVGVAPRAELYRSLTTAPASVVRRCIAGDLQACRVGFALDSMPANRVAAWYDESDFPTLARSAGTSLQREMVRRSLTADEQADCTERRATVACRRMLALLPPGAFAVPMPEAARASLAWLALETGGAPAYARWRANGTGTIGDQLAATSGLPVDSLLSRWMTQVRAARPDSPLPNASFALASFAVILVCAGVSMRGQPWN